MKRFLLIALCASQLSFGMQPDQFDQNELRLSLKLAVRYGDFERVKELLAAGVSPNHPASGCDSPLCYAVAFGHIEVCKALLDAGADVNWVEDFTKMTPIMDIRPDMGGADICTLLLVAGADVHAVDSNGMTPLMHACHNGHYKDIGNLKACELFLQYGADPEHRDKFGRQAIDFARERLGDYPESTEKLGKIIALLSDPEKIRAVIMREDNPNIKSWRKTSPNICNALMGREMDRE